MDEFENVLCLCPSSRLSLASLVLSTWTRVRRYVLTENDAANTDGFSAVLVMDRFVTKEIVERLRAKLPVVVLAWNGWFEIERYRKELGDLDVIYMGTDETTTAAIRYLPLINGDCAFRTWSELYRSKRQFSAIGSATYRARWLRTRVLLSRAVSVLISAGGAVRRPRALAVTLQSGVIRDKLVWAGNCYLDFATIGLTEVAQTTIETRLAAIRALPTPPERLRGALDLIHDWRAIAAEALPPERAHHAFYVTNTLLRWAVLAYLRTNAPDSTWFFGRDNMSLGLELELYVHNLVPNRRVAFLEFGGKTSETNLYPRSLHLLSREYYVLPIPPPDAADAVVDTVERIERGLVERPAEFFQRLEHRRRALYDQLPADCSLRDAQARVWNDFAAG
jgi:hypothetical protein